MQKFSTQPQRGFALMVILISVVFFGALVLVLHRFWLEYREQFHSELNRMKLENAAGEAVKHYLTSSADSPLWLSPPLLWSNLPKQNNDIRTRVLLLKKQARPGRSFLPSWKYLRANNLVFVPKPREKIFHFDASPVMAIAGNLQAGTVAVPPECASCSLVLVALGDIEIDELAAPAVGITSELLSSSAGSIRIKKLAPGWNWCRDKETGPELRIEAATELWLEDRKIVPPVFGCPLERDEPLWPKTQLIGGPP